MSPYRLTTEVFCLPHAGQFLVYAPLKGLIMLVNPAGADVLHRLAQGELAGTDADNLEFVSSLMDVGLVNGEPDEVHRDDEAEFLPTTTTLFVTTGCNLRCTYCYASGGDDPQIMKPEVARSAVDLIARNAEATGAESIGVSFHGGGEPTLAWPLVRDVLAYAREAAGDRDLYCACSLATNGVLKDEVLDWIIEEVEDVNVSVDGVGEAHDRQRPLKGGGPSFLRVRHTIERLTERERRFGLRMTVTEQSLPGIVEAVEFFASETTPHTIHLEPVFQCGRCVTEQVDGPSVEAFVEAFRRARDVAEPRGIRVYYSGARYPQITTTFCAAAGGSFTVTTDGHVTACYEVCSASDPRSETFFFGRWDDEARQFVFDQDRRRWLAELTVYNVSFCENCFCKYHCAGDCPAKRLAAFRRGQPDRMSRRCQITQELTRDQIVGALHRGSLTAEVARREHALAKEGPARG